MATPFEADVDVRGKLRTAVLEFHTPGSGTAQVVRNVDDGGFGVEFDISSDNGGSGGFGLIANDGVAGDPVFSVSLGYPGWQRGLGFDGGMELTYEIDGVPHLVYHTGNFTPGALAFLNSVDNSNWSGTNLSVPNGGTGASTLTGYVKGSGTSALTASATIPNTDITGLGTASTQNTGTSGGTVPLLNGNNTSSGSNTQSGAQFLTGVISPTALAAATDNWAPTGFATCNVVRMDATLPVALNGLAGGATGRCIRLVNISASVVTIVAGAGTSTAANRFASGLAIAAGSFVDLWYDGTTSRWRLSR